VLWRGQETSRAASLCLVAALGFMLIVSLAASAGLSALEQWSTGKAVLSALNTVVSLGIFTLLFAAICRVLPDTTIYWRHLLLGAFVTALLFTVPRSGSPELNLRRRGCANRPDVLGLLLRADIFVRRRTDEGDR
jgi:uncharacterized BrkB/YihY/UPF0761 family membrane protein